MQITLNQDEIHHAVENYVRSQINIAEGQEVTIDFTAGRGPNGLSATLDIKAAVAKAPVHAYPAEAYATTAVEAPARTASQTVGSNISSTPEDRQEPEPDVQEDAGPDVSQHEEEKSEPEPEPETVPASAPRSIFSPKKTA